MSTDGNLDFKIGIIGPNRAGKTSLIASILRDGQRLLEGTPMRIGPRGINTERRLAQHQKDLDGSLRAGEFNTDALRGTKELFTFELHLDPGVDSAGIHLSLLDYPGGWLNPDLRPPEAATEWEKCKRWMTESTVLLIPIESAVLMEAVSATSKKAVPHILTLPEVAGIAREWAKERRKRPGEPALLLFCPVKCESYFSDNSGFRESSAELFSVIHDHYQDVIQAVRGEASHIKIVYSPVDTIGCVEIVRANWHTKDVPGGLEFSADYRVRPPGRLLVKGADAVLISLCRHLVEAKRRAEAAVAKTKEYASDASRQFAGQDEGFLGNLWLWISGGRRRRWEVVSMLSAEVIAQRKMVELLQQTIERLASRELGPRVREM